MEENSLVNLKLDVVFKSFFAKKENEHLLLDFLSSILDIPLEEIESVEVKNPEVPVESQNEKFSRMDLNLTVSGRNINIEIQVESEDAYKERAVYYWAKLFLGLKKGESYADTNDTIAIHILNHDLFDCETYQSSFRFYEEKRHELLTNKCGIHFFELTKVDSKLNVNNKKELWLNLIKADSKERFEEIANSGSEIMSNAVKVIYNMQDDTRIREAARQREKALYDMRSSIALAERRGRQQGLAEGRDEGILIGRDEGISIGEARGISIGRDEGILIGRDEGISIGEARGRNNILNEMVSCGMITPEQAAQF